jgi:hypothetical protein
MSVIVPPLHHIPLVFSGWGTFGVAVSKRSFLQAGDSHTQLEFVVMHQELSVFINITF